MTLRSLTLLLFTFTLCSNPAFAQNLQNPIVDDDVVFQEADGMVAVEAEYFYKQSKSEIRQWYVTAKDKTTNVGRDEDGSHCKDAGNNAYIEILPDTRVTHGDVLTAGENFSNEAGTNGHSSLQGEIRNPWQVLCVGTGLQRRCRRQWFTCGYEWNLA